MVSSVFYIFEKEFFWKFHVKHMFYVDECSGDKKRPDFARARAIGSYSAEFI